MRAAVGFDASFWAITDPATLLPTGGLVHNLPVDICEPYYEHELLVPDVNKFVELVGATRTVRRAQSGHERRPSAKCTVPGDRRAARHRG